MVAEALIEQTVSRFPRFAAARTIHVEPVEKGGSDRNYYRVRTPTSARNGHDEHNEDRSGRDAEPRSLILVKYGDSREENRHYCAIAHFLASLGIHVPEIYFHDEAQRLIWMEDLGERDLWSFRHEPWPRRRELYGRALDEIVALHTRAHSAPERAALTLQAEFNAELYRWEQSYFFENCVGRVFGLDPEAVDAACPRDALDEIAEALAAQPRVLVHRDFQSQNILVCGAAAYLIDFQGLRPGLAQYDLASLVYDPYVALTAAERDELVKHYVQKSIAAGVGLASDFQALFDLCAMQRVMQALGAYGFLGLVKGRAHFLNHVPAALASLCEVLARIPRLERLSEFVAGLSRQSASRVQL